MQATLTRSELRMTKDVTVRIGEEGAGIAAFIDKQLKRAGLGNLS
jgi:hypothetical protein